MWKLLSGIALVVLLDVAFIWMIAVGPDAPEIARNTGPAAAVPIIHDQSMEEAATADDRDEPSPDDTDEVRDVLEPRANKRTISHTRRRRTTRRAPVAATYPRKLFQDTIIWIGRKEVPVKTDDREEVRVLTRWKIADATHAGISTPLAEEKKNRSFESKAYGVIKKPYELLRDFAYRIR